MVKFEKIKKLYFYFAFCAFIIIFSMNMIITFSFLNKINYSSLSTKNITSSDEIPYGINLVAADKAWSRTKGSSDIIIAVLDSGFDKNHPDLNGIYWNNSCEISDNGIDDDQNGYVDDCYGWDFIHENNDPYSLLTTNSVVLKAHGTHVVGIIAARMNDYGVVGIAPNVTVMPLRVVNEQGLNPDLVVAEAIRYATDNGAHIISMSIGIYDIEITNTTSYSIVEQSIEYAYQKGVLIVSSAGNEASDKVVRPSNHPNVIAVGAINSQEELASFSNHGPDLEVVAPGVDVNSTYPVDVSIQRNFSLSSGTSQAAPHVSGALGLILSFEPTLSNIEARLLLQQSTKDLGIPGRDETYGYGLINVSRALDIISLSKSNSSFPNTFSTTTLQNSSERTIDSKTSGIENITWIAIFALVSYLKLIIRRKRN